jgi:uncharacterized membrane protein (DUF4010 family)
VKYLGASRGVLLAAAAGGLVSSTAVMTTNARRARNNAGSAPLLAAGVSIATAVALARTIVLVGVLNAELLAVVAPPLAGAALASGGAALWLAYGRGDSGRGDPALTFRNPFDLASVFGFALLLGVVLIVSRLASEKFGAGGAIVAALVTGLGDTDSVAVSMAQLAPAPLSAATAGFAVLAATLANTLSKLAIGAAVGRGHFAWLVAAATAAAIVAGIAAFLLVWPFLPD